MDEKIMLIDGRKMLIQMLNEIDPEARYSENLEEVTDMYGNTVKRLRVAIDEEFGRRLGDEIGSGSFG